MRSSANPQSTALAGIRQRAQREKSRRFDNLYGLVTEPMLRWAFFQLRPDASAGIDRVTWNGYSEDLSSNLAGLHRRLVEQRYRAPKVRRTYIPKSNGKLRPLGIPCLEDKIVQRAVAEILTSVFDGDFHRGSYGYRPGIGAHDAVQDLTAELQFGIYGYVVEADIKGFFDHIDHAWLLEMIGHRIDDRKLIRLIGKWLKAGILEPDGSTIHPATGTPQGGVVSPILANIYLHYALDLWFEKVVKRHSKGRCFLVRFADDYVAGFQLQDDAAAFEKAQPGRLGKFGLEVEPTKTGTHRFTRFNTKNGGSFDFLGFTFRWQQDRKGLPRVTRTTAKKKFRASLRTMTEWLRTARNWPSKRLFQSLRRKLTGYWNYYGVRGNSRMLSAMWYQVYNLLFKWLNRRSQRRSYTKMGLAEALKFFRVPMPRITERPRTRAPAFLWQ